MPRTCNCTRPALLSQELIFLGHKCPGRATTRPSSTEPSVDFFQDIECPGCATTHTPALRATDDQANPNQTPNPNPNCQTPTDYSADV
jgi:hypothetical protein